MVIDIIRDNEDEIYPYGNFEKLVSQLMWKGDTKFEFLGELFTPLLQQLSVGMDRELVGQMRGT